MIWKGGKVDKRVGECNEYDESNIYPLLLRDLFCNYPGSSEVCIHSVDSLFFLFYDLLPETSKKRKA